jgi:NitT/TauT family transport system substrate-binding protein
MKLKMTRREAISLGLMAAAGATLTTLPGCNWLTHKKIPTLTSGYIPILDSTPLIVAYEKGFFKEFGVSAEKPQLIRTWPALLEAFTSKKILLTHILLPQVIFLRYAQNINLKSLAFNHTDVISMLIAKELNSIKDLGGKLVGCPTWWSPHTGIFQDVLRSAGLTPVVGKEANALLPNEVGFRVIAPPDMPEGLKTGAIAGCTVSEPFGAVAEIKAQAKIIKFSGDVWKNHPCCQSVLLEETLNIDKSWAQNITNAIYKASLWAHDNKSELAQMLGSDGGGYFPMPAKAITRALMKNDAESYGPEGSGAIMHKDWNVSRVEFNPYPFPSAFDVTLDMMRRMIVDPSVALPDKIRNLNGTQVAHDIVEYEMAQTAYRMVGGKKAFNMTDSLGEFERTEKYEVVLK